ncbi:hypothetical protein P3X46_009068, partial [Hevea brasiliensis]
TPNTIHTCSFVVSLDFTSSGENPTCVPTASYDFAQFSQYQASLKPTSSPITAIAESGKSTTCLVSSSSKWVIDSGATDHMTGNSSLLSAFQSNLTSNTVTLADGSTSCVMGSGTANPTSSISFKLTRTLNCSVSFFDRCLFRDLTTAIIGRGRESGGLYILENHVPRSLVCSSTLTPLEAHCRLGHPSLSTMKKLCPQFQSLSVLECESCQFAKHHRLPSVSRVNKRASSPFELVHSDVWGPCSVTSKTGFRYFVTFVDDYSRVTWLYLMKNRSELFSIFCAFCNEIKTQFNISVRILRSNNAKEYFSAQFLSYMTQNGILHQSSCMDTPSQNGVAERKNRHLLEVTRSLLFHMKVPKHFWADAEDDLLIYTVQPMSSPLPQPVPSVSRPTRPPVVHVYSRRLEIPDSDPPPATSLGDPVPHTDHDSDLDLPIALRKGKRSCTYPISSFVSYNQLSSCSRCFVTSLDSVPIPNTVGEALSHPGWCDAMKEEMEALDANGTWELLPLPTGKKAIGCKWVFTVKVNPDGSVARLKARLVAKGYAQTYGSLYGLKQSPRAWFGRFSEAVQEFGMQKSKCDHSVFYRQSEAGLILLVVYVDDIVITGSDSAGISSLKTFLQTQFQTKDLGLLKYFLGIEVMRSKKGIFLSQRKYVLDLLIETGKFGAKPCSAPMTPTLQASRDSELAMAQSVCEVMWILQLLDETGFKTSLPAKLWCDNQAALHIASNPVFHERTKHIEIDYHFIREKIQQQIISTGHIKTGEQLGDIFTKALNGARIDYICNKLGMINIYAPT